MADPALAPITTGKDFNKFAKVTVNTTAFNTDADFAINFRGQFSFSLVNEGTAIIEYSFNGTTLHGDMTPGTPTAALSFDNRRISKIWFRTSTPGQVVRVEAWAPAF